MGQTITASEYKALMGRTPSKDNRSVVKRSAVVPGVESPGTLTAKEACRAMGAYFEMPVHQVNFWIRQMELSKKI